MADDVSDEPPVGDARTSWLPAPSAQILALGGALAPPMLRIKMPGKSCSRPPRRSRSRVPSDGACARRCRSSCASARRGRSHRRRYRRAKTPMRTRGRQDRTELILVDGVVALASQEPVDGDAKSRAARKKTVPTPLRVAAVPAHPATSCRARARGARPQAGRRFVRGRRRRVRPRRRPGDGGIVARALFGGPIAQGELVAVCARDSWAPVAVGRFSKSSEDMVLGEPRRRRRRDSSESATASGPTRPWTNPRRRRARPNSASPRRRRRPRARTDAAALAAERHAARTAAAAAAAHAAEVLDLKARTKRLAKSLRQVADLRGRELKDDAQRAKAARGPALEAELAYAEARLAELQRAVDGARLRPTVRLRPLSRDAAERDRRAAAPAPMRRRRDRRRGRRDRCRRRRHGRRRRRRRRGRRRARRRPRDEIFRAALTTLRRDLKPPVLAAEAVGAAAKLGGASVKETSLEEGGQIPGEPAGVVDCRQVQGRPRGRVRGLGSSASVRTRREGCRRGRVRRAARHEEGRLRAVSVRAMRNRRTARSWTA